MTERPEQLVHAEQRPERVSVRVFMGNHHRAIESSQLLEHGGTPTL
jgi:hypothetical protein